jgi:peptide/nickel transport system permease protein
MTKPANMTISHRDEKPVYRLPWPLVAGGLLLGLHLALALLTLVWTPYGVGEMVGGRLEAPSWLALGWHGSSGTRSDDAIIIGSRIALVVGCGAIAISAVIGVTLGVLAAFATQTLDDVLAAALDILIAFPTLLLAMLIVASSDGASLTTAMVAIGIAGSAIVARLTRILAKRVLATDYITGIAHFRHFVVRIGSHPCAAEYLADPDRQFCASVRAGSYRGSIAFISWSRRSAAQLILGALLQEAQASVYTAPFGAIAPGLALVSLVIGLNLFADGLRDVADPTRRRRH